MLVKAIPGLPGAPHWLLNESLVTWECFQYKFGLNLGSQAKESTLSHTHCRCSMPRVRVSARPLLSLHPRPRTSAPGGDSSPDSWSEGLVRLLLIQHSKGSHWLGRSTLTTRVMSFYVCLKKLSSTCSFCCWQMATLLGCHASPDL